MEENLSGARPCKKKDVRAPVGGCQGVSTQFQGCPPQTCIYDIMFKLKRKEHFYIIYNISLHLTTGKKKIEDDTFFTSR